MHPFRQGLLTDRSIALSGEIAHAITELLNALGARVSELHSGLAADEERVSAWARATGPFDALVCGQDGDDALLTGTWATVRAVATEAFIPRHEGRIVLLAPRDDGGVLAAGLENLARTLSVEWARFGVTTVAIAPGASTSEVALARLVAFLCSQAGAYYSGCRFELGAAG